MAGEVVYLGCKMPLGVVLNLDKYEVLDERSGVVRKVISDVPPVRLKGNAHRNDKPDLSIDGYVFTPVPKEFWDQWLATHADSSLIKDGFIMPAKTMDEARKASREREAERGQNPRLDVEGRDPRLRGLESITAADEQKAKRVA